MSDTRRRPPVSGPRAGVAPDAPEATNVSDVDDEFDYFAARRPEPEPSADDVPAPELPTDGVPMPAPPAPGSATDWPPTPVPPTDSAPTPVPPAGRLRGLPPEGDLTPERGPIAERHRAAERGPAAERHRAAERGPAAERDHTAEGEPLPRRIPRSPAGRIPAAPAQWWPELPAEGAPEQPAESGPQPFDRRPGEAAPGRPVEGAGGPRRPGEAAPGRAGEGASRRPGEATGRAGEEGPGRPGEEGLGRAGHHGGEGDAEAPTAWNPWRRPPLDTDPETAAINPIPPFPPPPLHHDGPDFGGPNFGGGNFGPHGQRFPSAPLPAWAQAPQPEPEYDEEPRPAPRRREPFLDNAKFLLIALVVTGHMLRDSVGADGAHVNRAAYIFIYAFHMPLFVVISGYLSRNFWNSNAKTNKLVDTFLVPYVVVETGYALLRYALGQKFSLTITDPAWLNWYLIALLFWRLSTPVWKRMKFPLVIAVAVCLFSGFSELSGDFSMDRFFGLLPFFVLGLVIKQEHFELLGRVWARILGVLVLGAWAGVAFYLAPRLKLAPFYFNASYHDLNQTWWYGLAFRSVFLLGAATLCLAVLALVPRRDTWFSDLGTRTLYCYLLHGIPILIAKDMGWLDLPWLYGPLGTAAIMASALALAIVLCLPITRTLFKWLLEPRLTWLYRRPSNPPQNGPQPEVKTEVPADSRA